MNTQIAVHAARGAALVNHCVIAAVHPGSNRLAEIAARANARAKADDSSVVYVTICTRRPVGDELARMRRALSRFGIVGDLVMSWANLDGVPRSEHPSVIADELIAAAQRLRASALVVGHDPLAEPSRHSVVARLAGHLRPATDLVFGTELGAAPDLAATDREFTYADDVYLTDDGRERLSKRRHALERKDLPRLRHRMHQQPTGPAVLTYESALNDLRVLTALIDHAPSTSDIPDDPQRVELGEHVELAAEHANRRTVTVVADIEAGRGPERVAASSALGRALLGQRVGDWTTIPTSRGPQAAQVLAATR